MDAEATSPIALLNQLAECDDGIVKFWGIIQANYLAFGGMETPSAFFKAVKDVLSKVLHKVADDEDWTFKLAALSFYPKLSELLSDPVALFTNSEKILQSRMLLQDFCQNCIIVHQKAIIKIIRSLYEEEKPLQKAPILRRARELNIFAGSILEGSWLVRFLTEEELEVDLMALIGELKPDVSRNIIDGSQSPPGFCRLKMPDSIREMVNHPRHLRSSVEELQKIFRPEHQYISSRDVKQCYRLWLDETNYKPFPTVPEPEVKGSQEASFDVVRPPIEAGIGGASLFQILGKSFLEEHGEQTPVTLPPDYELRTVADLVPCVKLQEWPTVATEWRERQRLWPPKDVVDEIVEGGCHLVVKSPNKKDGENAAAADDYQWRFSFSIAEYRLADLRTTHQRLVYFLFKHLFYRELKTVECNGTRLSSYVVKTVMMWAMEEVPPSDWGSVGSDPLPDLTLLLGRLATHLDSKRIANYFVPDANLLVNVPDELLKEASQRVQQMAADPLPFLSKQIPTTADVVMKIVKGFW